MAEEREGADVAIPKVRQAAIRAGFRSGLEQDNAKHLKQCGCSFSYETEKIKYTPAVKTYTPDFVLENGIIVETKGRFIPTDRAKHLLVKAQHPELDIRFVFTNARQRLSKRSKTTYGDWCDKHGFEWAEGLIPKEWMRK